jgi:hypothetical protein
MKPFCRIFAVAAAVLVASPVVVFVAVKITIAMNVPEQGHVQLAYTTTPSFVGSLDWVLTSTSPR